MYTHAVLILLTAIRETTNIKNIRYYGALAYIGSVNVQI